MTYDEYMDGGHDADGPHADAPRVRAAEAKRARKAAKRRRDAELTRLGREAARGAVALSGVRPMPSHLHAELIGGQWRCVEYSLHAVRRRRKALRVSRVARARSMVEVTP